MTVIPDSVSIKEAAEYLSISEKTVRNYVYAGKFNAYKIGGKYRITRESLESFVTDNFIPKGEMNHEPE